MNHGSNRRRHHAEVEGQVRLGLIRVAGVADHER